METILERNRRTVYEKDYLLKHEAENNKSTKSVRQITSVNVNTQFNAGFSDKTALVSPVKPVVSPQQLQTDSKFCNWV